MALTRDYKETVLARSDATANSRGCFSGAIEMLLEGQMTEALSRLRDLVDAEITFKELAADRPGRKDAAPVAESQR
jgi:hypothetical protein